MQRRNRVGGSPRDEVCASSILLCPIPWIVAGAIDRCGRRPALSG